MEKNNIITKLKALREQENKIDEDIKRILEDIERIRKLQEERKKFFEDLDKVISEEIIPKKDGKQKYLKRKI